MILKNIIQTNLLTKKYDDKIVVNNLNLQVPEGCVYGFLGPNGAGKSTTMKMLLHLVKPTFGDIFLFEKEMSKKNRLKILSDIGSLIESPAYYGHLSGKENLEIICELKNVSKKEISRVLSLVHMEHAKHKKVGQYSLGMKQRLALGAALLGNPKLLFLDEPTNGLDPAGILEIRELIRSLPKQGITIFLSSHLLSEIDQMATDVGIIDEGRLIFQDSLCALHEKNGRKIFFKTDNDQLALKLLSSYRFSCSSSHTSSSPASYISTSSLSSCVSSRNFEPSSCKFSVIQEENQIYLDNVKDSDIIEAVKLCINAGIGVLRIEERQVSLEDIFLNLTRK